MKNKLQSTVVKCRVCGDSHGPLYKDEINHDVYLCKTCKDLIDYERSRYMKKESDNATEE